MDLDTLPDEMFTNIMKYTDFETGRRLRKMNERIDKLARRAKIYGKIEVETLAFVKDNVNVRLNEEYATKRNFEKFSCIKWENESQYLKLLDDLLTGISKVEQIQFAIRQFNDKDVQLMTKHKKSLRNVKTLVFQRVYFSLSKTSAEAFIKNVCPNVEEIRVCICENSENIFDAELLSNRKWKKLFLLAPNLLLDGTFLIQVVANCEKAELHQDDSLFTVRGVLDMLKKCFIVDDGEQDILLEHVRLGLIRLEEIEPLFRAEIPGIEIKIEEWTDNRQYDMDLNTLPDEMFTNILKYTDFDTGRILRKINKRIDELAKRAGISGKIEVDTLSFDKDCMVISLNEEYAKQRNFAKVRCLEWEDEPHYLEMLDELHLINVVNEVQFSKRQLNDKDVQLMNKNRESLRNVKILTFENVDFALSEASAYTFINNVCTSVDEIRIALGEHSEKIFNTELLSGRKWKNLGIYEPDFPLDDNFLLKVVVNCEKTEFRLFHSLFTVRGVLDMLKKCFIDREDNQYIRLEDVRLGHVCLDEIEPLFRAEIPGIEIKIEERGETRRYDITLPDKPKRCRFSVIIEQQEI